MRKQIDRIVFDAEVSDRKILLVPAHTLIHTPYNPPRRTKDGIKLKRLAESLKKSGQAYPILITAERHVIDGNRRLAALKSIGKDFVECLIFEGDKDESFRDINDNMDTITGKDRLVIGRSGGKLKKEHQAMYSELLSLIGTYGIDLLIEQNVGLNILPMCKNICAQGTTKRIDEVIMKTATKRLSNKLNVILRSDRTTCEKVKEIDFLIDGVQ